MNPDPVGFRRNGAGGAGTTKPVVYNTLEEIRKFGEVLGKIAGNEEYGNPRIYWLQTERLGHYRTIRHLWAHANKGEATATRNWRLLLA